MSEKPFDHYLLFEPLDFVMDEDFQSWVLQGKPEQNAYWQSFRVAFPQKAPAVDTARLIVKQVRAGHWQTLTPHQLHERFQKVLVRIDPPKVRVIPLYQRWWARVAAVLLLGLLGWQTYQYGWAPSRYQTAFGQQQRVLLSDQTLVTLAPNSTLRVPGRWQFGRQREVWLSGEAYFEVAKQAAGTSATLRNFLVHARELHIEVLGTRFNVNTFRHKTTVLLEEGRVRLTTPTQPGKAFLLRPGEVAEKPARQTSIRIAPSADPSLAAWRTGQLIFRAAPLRDLTRRVEEIYGFTLVFEGDGWEDATFTGELPTTDTELLIRILSETFGAGVTWDHNGKQLILKTTTSNP